MLLELFYVAIAVAGVFVGRRFGRLASFGFMIEMYQVVITVIVLINTGYFRPLGLIPGVGVLPGIGRYSGVSAGGLIPPLVFLLVAVFSRRKSLP